MSSKCVIKMQSRTTTTAGKQQWTLNDNLVSQILCQIETVVIENLSSAAFTV